VQSLEFVTLKMSVEEARMLMSMVQNPNLFRLSKDEGEEIEKFRREVWETLKSEGIKLG